MRSELLAAHNRYAWLVAWPLILLAVVASCTRSCSGGSPVMDSAERDAVQAFGQKAVKSYVSASPVDMAGVEAIYGPLVAAPSDDAGFPFPAETVVSVTAGTGCLGGSTADGRPVQTPELLATREDKTKVWIVRADVLTDSADQCWQQQVVTAAGGAYRVDGLPGRIPAAPIASPPLRQEEQGHGLTRVESGSQIYTTVAEFFDAWLAGQGDFSRLAGDTVRAFSEPPYGSISVDEVSASRQPDKPDKSVNVAASITATKIAKMKLFYNLTLTAVGGRWVVTDVSAAPAGG